MPVSGGKSGGNVEEVARATGGTVLVSATSAGSGNELASVPLDCDGGDYDAEFSAAEARCGSAAGDVLHVGVFVDGVFQNRVARLVGNNDANNNSYIPIFGRLRITPAAGPRTIAVRGWKDTADNDGEVVGNAPTILRVLKKL